MTVCVKTISGKTIRIKDDKKQREDTISEKIEIRTAIPRGVTYLIHQGQMLNDNKTIEESNIEAETTIEMCVRLLEGMENDMIDGLIRTRRRKKKESWK